MKTGGATLTGTLARRPAQVSYLGYETLSAATDFSPTAIAGP